MPLDSSTIAAIAVTGTTIIVLLFSVLLLNRFRKAGTLERALAHTVIDATRRRAFLIGISTLAGTFVAMGATFILANLKVIPDAVGDALTTSIFCSGAIALLYMIRTGFQVSHLSLEDELDLRDFEPKVFGALAGHAGDGTDTAASLYVSPPIDSGSEPGVGSAPTLLW